MYVARVCLIKKIKINKRQRQKIKACRLTSCGLISHVVGLHISLYETLMYIGRSVYVGEISAGLHSQFVLLRTFHLTTPWWTAGRAVRRQVGNGRVFHPVDIRYVTDSSCCTYPRRTAYHVSRPVWHRNGMFSFLLQWKLETFTYGLF